MLRGSSDLLASATHTFPPPSGQGNRPGIGRRVKV